MHLISAIEAEVTSGVLQLDKGHLDDRNPLGEFRPLAVQLHATLSGATREHGPKVWKDGDHRLLKPNQSCGNLHGGGAEGTGLDDAATAVDLD